MSGAARGALRAGTAGLHADVEAALGVHGPLDADRYRRVLAGLLGLHEPVEAALAAAPPSWWPVCERAPLAVADLVAFGASAAEVDALPRVAAPAVGDEAAWLGCAYVVEGASLGAATLRHRLRATLPDAPTSFLDAARPDRWRSFVAVLDDRLADPARCAAAVAAARSTFASLLDLCAVAAR